MLAFVIIIVAFLYTATNLLFNDKDNIFRTEFRRFKIQMKDLYRHLNLSDLIVIFMSKNRGYIHLNDKIVLLSFSKRLETDDYKSFKLNEEKGKYF